MADPQTAVQIAVYSALTSEPPLMALVTAVFDEVKLPNDADVFGAAEGYISFGPEQVIEEIYDCIDVDVVFLQIDVWSRKRGRLHCKAICALVREAIAAMPPDLGDHAIAQIDLELFTIERDPRPGLHHGVLQFRFDLEVAA